MSIASEIQRLQNAKRGIKEVLLYKGIDVGDGTIDTYSSKMFEQIKNPFGNIDITENGTYDVADKETATVRVGVGAIEGEGKHEVRFIDYDGTLLKIHYVNDGESATAPELPTHSGLTFVEWNRDYTNITHDLDVGAIYKTSSDTYLYINVTEETSLRITLNISRSVSSGNIRVYWGDGSPVDTFATGSGAKSLTHTYSEYGEYMIQIITTTNYRLGGGSNTKPVIVGSNEINNFRALKKCYCSDKVIQISSYAFFNNINLEEFTMSKVTSVGTYAFCGTKQKALIFPKSVTTVSQRVIISSVDLEYYILNNEITSLSQPTITNTNIRKMIFPENYETASYTYGAYASAIKYLWHKKPSSNYTLGTNFVSSSPVFEKVPIYDNLTEITGATILSNTNINKIALPPSLTKISNGTLSTNYRLTDVYIYAHTPPTLAGTSVFSGNALTKIHVYPEDLEKYQTATNWSTSSIKSKLVGDLEGEFKDGYC